MTLRLSLAVVLVAACGGDAVPQPAKRAAPAEPSKLATPDVKSDDAKVPDAKVEAPRADAPTERGPDVRGSVFFRKAPQRGRATVWHASAADPSVPEQLPFVVDFDPGGAAGVGTTTPLLSQNGTWIAYLDRGHLVVAMLDGTVKRRITKHGPAQVTVLISGFSPDSASLLFEQHEVQAEAALPLPADVTPGFQLLELIGYESRLLADLPSFEAWTPGSTRVVLERRANGSTELVAYDVDSGKLELQQSVADNYGFTQIVVGAEHVAWVAVPKEHASQVVRAKLDGSAKVELSPVGEFAQYQWPRVSVDGKHVAYADGKKIVRVGIDGGTAADVTVCGSGDCDHTWESNTALLVRDGPELARYEIERGKTVIATDVVGFAVAGDPG